MKREIKIRFLTPLFNFAKKLGKKEVLARLFLGQIQDPSRKIKKEMFQEETIQNFQNIFKWLDNSNNPG
jgi:hypothetical protein